MTADRLEPGVLGNDDFISRTLPMPAIDIAGFQPSAAVAYQEPAAPAAVAATGSPGLARVARGGAINLFGAVISAAATLGLTVIITHSFSKLAVGTFFVATSLFLIVEAVTNLGAYNGTIYFIARLRALRAERRIPAIIRATIIPVAISSVIGAVAVIAFAHPLAGILVGRTSTSVSTAAVASTLRVLAVALPFAALADTMLGAARGYHEMRPTVVVDRICRPSFQLLGVAAAAAAGSSALLAPLWALPYLPATITAMVWLREIMRRHRVPLAVVPAAGQRPAAPSAPAARAVSDNRHGRPNASGFWRFTAPRSIASVAQIVIQRMDIVLVGIIKGPVEAAIYTAATRFLVAGQLGNAAISMAAQPQLTQLFATRNRSGASTVYQVTTAWLILLTWPLYLLAIVFGPSVLAIFGRSYHAGNTVMIILALAMLVATACGQVDMVLITAGRSSWSLFNGLAAMAVNIGVDLALIPRMGITGAAIGWAAAIAITNLVPLVQVAAAERVHPFGPGMAAACALTVVSFGAIPLGLRALAGQKPAVSIGALALGCVVMALGMWRMRGILHLSAMPGLGRITRMAQLGRT